MARVRAKIGHVNSHPGALEITASNGTVVVSESILASDVERTLAGIRSVRGVKRIDNHLEVHEQADDIPALQTGGTVPRALHRQETLWPPSTRLFEIASGALLVLSGHRRRESLTSLPGRLAPACSLVP